MRLRMSRARVSSRVPWWGYLRWRGGSWLRAICSRVSVSMFARIHDLLEIDVERFLQAQVETPAEWVAGSLREAPFVVVRRGLVSTEQGISIGVRGTRRNERWAGVCYPNIVRAMVTPQALLRRVVSAGQIASLSQRGPAHGVTPSASGLMPSASSATPSARSAALPALRSLPLL